MKNIIHIVCLFLVGLIVSCSKDRIDHPSFKPMDEFYNKHKVEEQEFVISNEDSSGPIVGNQGTELYLSRRLFKFSDRNDEVTFPYVIKLVELYKYKDVIFYQMPTPHINGPLNNGGEIRVRAYKDAEELVLRSGSSYESRFSAAVTETNMDAFQGVVTSSEEFSSWKMATDGSNVSVNNGKYVFNSFLMGWITPGKNTPGSGSTNIDFKVKGSGGEVIDLILAFKNFHGVVMGNDLKLNNLPIGESATLLGMAMDDKGKYRLHQSEITISNSMTIDLKMEEVDEATLLATLESL